MKKSLIYGGGFEVFALCDFSEKEFVTVYLGQKFNNTYMFGEILGLSKKFKTSSFQEVYWFGHMINHGSGGKQNWKLRAVMYYKQWRKSNVEKSYFGIIIVIVFVLIAINGSTFILSSGYNIRSIPSAKILENQKSTVLGARDTFALIVMTVFKLTHFNYTIKSYLFKNI